MPQINVKIQTTYQDGSIKAAAKGWYWRMEVAENSGHYGPLHGPFGSETTAQTDAREFLAGEIRRLSLGATLTHIKVK